MQKKQFSLVSKEENFHKKNRYHDNERTANDLLSAFSHDYHDDDTRERM
jgi:hypothetical protein